MEAREELKHTDRIKEQIRFGIEKFRLCILGLMTVGGGTVSLITNGNMTGAKSIFVAWGIMLLVSFTTLGYRYYKQTNSLIG